MTEGLSGTRPDNTMAVQPVVLQSISEKPLKFYSPIVIRRSLFKEMYCQSCTPLHNGNLLIRGGNILQAKFVDPVGTGVFIPVLDSRLKPASMKGVIYNVPLEP